jgi:hypothetical protein
VTEIHWSSLHRDLAVDASKVPLDRTKTSPVLGERHGSFVSGLRPLTLGPPYL